MLRTKWSERLLLRKIPMMHIKKRLIELSVNHNTTTKFCILKSFIFPWFTVVTCFHFHVLTTKGSRCLEFWLMVYCRVSTIDLWSHKIIGHLVKMKYCMKVPTYIKKKTNKQTQKLICILLFGYYHNFSTICRKWQRIFHVNGEWGWLGKYTHITNASVCYKYQHTTFCSPQHWLNNVLSTFEH